MALTKSEKDQILNPPTRSCAEMQMHLDGLMKHQEDLEEIIKHLIGISKYLKRIETS